MDKFLALSDPTRRNIIDLLAVHGELSVNEIVDNFHISQPAISQHLKILREASLVAMEKRSQQRLYAVNFKGLSEVEAWIQDATKQWNTRFDALEKMLQKRKASYDK